MYSIYAINIDERKMQDEIICVREILMEEIFQ